MKATSVTGRLGRNAALVLLSLVVVAPLAAQRLELGARPELLLPGLVSTEASEVRITWSPDGSRMLWGSINRPGGPGGWEIWESVREKDGWSTPHPASFDSPENDFDPSFAPDGRGLFFFSNRPGGLGGDDLWYVPFDPATGQYGVAVNLGAGVNSKGDEWAPVAAAGGTRLLFASDGRGGRGRHDLFVSALREGRWSDAEPVAGELNSAEDDFDATYLDDGETLVFTRRVGEQDGADLYVAFAHDGRYGAAQRLDARVNAPGSWNLGPSLRPGERGLLYFTSHRDGESAGRLDLYRVSCEVRR